MVDKYIRKQDAVNVVANTAKIVASFNYQYAIDALSALAPADVVSVSAYKQVLLERDTVVEQLKQIGKDIREVMDDVVHLQRQLSADVVKIVRCKNCKYHNYDKVFGGYWCEHPFMAGEVNPDFYCGYGEE